MNRSGYVLAGVETLANIIDNFILNTKNRFENNFTRDDIAQFLGNTCSGFLHSYGQSFTNRKSYKKYNDNETKLFKKCRETQFFKNSSMLVDSGGFQVSMGKLEKNETELLIELYHKFLEEHSEVYERAFVLDLTPGPDCKIFNSFKDVYDMNLRTYTMASSFPSNIKEKMIYIHHFRTPKMWRIFQKIMKDNDLFKEFNYHATGGIVANTAGDIGIPCIIYILPLIPLLNECKRLNRKVLNFHILGGSNFRDILFYELFQLHILKKHNIQVNFTYDSSGLFKGFMIGRFIHANNNYSLVKMDIRSANLENRFIDGLSVKDKYKQILEGLAKRHNFKKININSIYDAKTNTFFEEVKVYTMLYMLDQFAVVQNTMKECSRNMYSLYESGNTEEFVTEVSKLTQFLNGGKITKKQKSKTNSILTSLHMLSYLDEEHCLYIVDKLLYKDEFVKLEQYGNSMII